MQFAYAHFDIYKLNLLDTNLQFGLHNIYLLNIHYFYGWAIHSCVYSVLKSSITRVRGNKQKPPEELLAHRDIKNRRPKSLRTLLTYMQIFFRGPYLFFQALLITIISRIIFSSWVHHLNFISIGFGQKISKKKHF